MVCRSCGKSLSWNGDEDEKSAAVEKRLNEGHQSLCPWRDNPSPPSFESAIMLADVGGNGKCAAFEAYRRRLATFGGGRDDEKDNIVERIRIRELERFRNVDAALADATRALAALGWTRNETRVSCTICSRTIDLTAFLPREKPTSGGEGADVAEGTGSSSLCPVQQHRWWCPWTREWQRVVAEVASVGGDSTTTKTKRGRGECGRSPTKKAGLGVDDKSEGGGGGGGEEGISEARVKRSRLLLQGTI
eukprot:g4349.t1